MFMLIEDYMKYDQQIRKKHINLSESCIVIGNKITHSDGFRLVLAHFLKTTIPKGYNIHLCHACNNSDCSNPKHLYWGTAKENIQDQIDAGTHRSKTYIIGSFKHTEESKNKVRKAKMGNKCTFGTIMINNGTINKRIKKEESIPDGWKKGQLRKEKCS